MFQSEHYWQSPYVDWVSKIPEGWRLFIFYMRESRIKAKVPAVVEALSLWRSFHPIAPISGPLAEKKGVFWIALEPHLAVSAIRLLPKLGYSFAVDEVSEIKSPENTSNDYSSEENQIVRWRGVLYRLTRVYFEDRESFRNLAPDKRIFLLENDAGEVRPVKGYRGDGSDMSRRALPVEDARQLVNLVSPSVAISRDLYFLDPFAGAGGIVIEASKIGYTVFSLDIDKRLRHGLKTLSTFHQVGDATRLPFRDETFQAVATEPPYHKNAGIILRSAFAEICRVLKPHGRLSMLVTEQQAELLLKQSENFCLKLFLAASINRKGTDVVVLAWEKTCNQ